MCSYFLSVKNYEKHLLCACVDDYFLLVFVCVCVCVCECLHIFPIMLL